MPIVWIALVALLVAGGFMYRSSELAQSAAELSTIDTLAQSLLIYRSAVAQYAQSNPGFTGAPADAALNLPTWFVKPAGLSAHITGGVSYTYYANTQPGTAAALADATESEQVGVARAGTLFSPRVGATTIAIPTVIPDGSVIAVN